MLYNITYFNIKPFFRKLVQTSDVNNVMVSDPKGASTWKSAPKNDIVRNALNSD